jgi:CDP-diacylglycerol--glycerol-3-phosphate 3-phosphatidyltransferase
MNLANGITLGRIVLIPVLVLLFFRERSGTAFWSACLYALASSTDLLDGYIARRYNMVTTLGKLLDPIADKILVTTGLFLLVDDHLLPVALAILIVARELAVSGLRAIASADGIIIPAESLGKAKMVFQTISLTILIWNQRLLFVPGLKNPVNSHSIGMFLFWISLILTLVSGAWYFRWYLRLSGVSDSREREKE